MNKNIETKLDTLLRKDLSAHHIETIRNSVEGEISNMEFDEHIDVMKGIDAYGVSQLREELKAIALGIYAISNSSNSRTVDELFAEHYEPFDYSVGTRDADQATAFDLGVLYQDKKYLEFIDGFEQNFKSREDINSDLILACGVSYMETDQPYKAIFQFNRIIENQDFSFVDAAQWYKTLALFKAQEFTQCSESLSIVVSNQDSDFYEKGIAFQTDLQKYISK